MTGPGDLAFGPATIVYDGPMSFRFSYYDRLESGEEAVIDEWPSARRSPVAVRVAMIDPRTNAVTSSVRIPLWIDAEPGCAFPDEAYCSYVDRRQVPGPDAAAAGQPTGAGDAR